MAMRAIITGNSPPRGRAAILRLVSLIAVVGLLTTACSSDEGAADNETGGDPAAADQEATDSPGANGGDEEGDVEAVEITEDLIAAAQDEGTVVIRYSSPVNFVEAISAAFEEEYGITVEGDRRVGVQGTEQFSIEERADQHVVDVLWNSDPPGMQDLAEEGYLIDYEYSSDIMERVPDGHRIGTVGYSPYVTEVVIQYNPELISHEDAKEKLSTWRGLLDPEFSDGQLGLNEPAGGSVPFATYLMLDQHEDYGVEFLEELAAQEPRLYPGSAPGREDLAAGATKVFVPNWEYVAMQNFMDGDQTAWTYPDIAPSFSATYIGISENAPHPNAARLFSAWLVSDAGAEVLAELQVRSSLEGVEETRPAIDELEQTEWWEPYPDEIKWTPDQEYWDENYDELMPMYREILGWTGG